MEMEKKMKMNVSEIALALLLPYVSHECLKYSWERGPAFYKWFE